MTNVIIEVPGARNIIGAVRIKVAEALVRSRCIRRVHTTVLTAPGLADGANVSVDLAEIGRVWAALRSVRLCPAEARQFDQQNDSLIADDR
jgi:hypothetical protein